MKSTPGSDRVYHSLGVAVVVIYLTCAILAGLAVSPYLNSADPILVSAAVGLGLVGLLPLGWYLAWTLTSLVAKGRIDRDPNRPTRSA